MIVTAQPMDISAPPGWDVVDVSIGPLGEPVLLLWERPTFMPLDPLEARAPGITARRRRQVGPNRFRVLHHQPDGTVVVDVPETTRNYNRVQPLPGGEYLLDRSRDRDSDSDFDVYAANGELLRSWQSDGGVACATAGGRVWVGYGDQAVVDGLFAGGLGRYGAACFDSAGNLLVGFNDLARQQGIETIFDCYALNAVSDTEVWFWYYVGFPLVRVVEGHIDGHWPSLKDIAPIAGSHAFAVSGDRLLFHGGYDARDRFSLVSLKQEHSEEVTVVDPTGAPLPRLQSRSFGRGTRIYLPTNQALFVVDAATLPTW